MKKPIAFALGAAALALAYPATAWFLGMRIEAALDEQYRSLDDRPYIKLVSRQYQRGVFSSTETTTLELFGQGSPLPGKATTETPSGEINPFPAQPIRITLRSEITHGPLPELGTLAAAVADSELILDAAQQQRVVALLGDKKPLQVRTEFSLLGGGVSTASSPAFAFDLPATAEGKNSRVSWGGIQISINFNSGMRHYSLTGEAPSLEIKDDKGGLAQFSGLRMTADQQRLFDDEPAFYTGTSNITLDQLSFVGGADDEANAQRSLLLKQIRYDASVPVNGEFIDIIGKIGAEVAQFGAQNYGPVHYDFSLRHLHARSVASLNRALMKWYADPARLTAKEAGAPQQMAEALREPGLALLKFSPEIRVDRISFKTPQGDAQITASAKLGDLQPEELANPFMLLGKLAANAELALPEDMLSDKFPPQQIAAFVEQGYIQREGNTLRSKIAFANGQLTVNGKSFGPMPMGGGQ